MAKSRAAYLRKSAKWARHEHIGGAYRWLRAGMPARPGERSPVYTRATTGTLEKDPIRSHGSFLGVKKDVWVIKKQGLARTKVVNNPRIVTSRDSGLNPESKQWPK